MKSFEERFKEYLKWEHTLPNQGAFTYAEKGKIIKDWQTSLPDMMLREGTMKRRPKYCSFGRIVGPLLVSVFLKFEVRLVADYSVHYYVYNLAYKKEYMVVGLGFQPRGGISVKPASHERAYPLALEELLQDAYIPVNGPVSLRDIFKGYERYYNEGYQRNYVGKKYLSPHEAAAPALVAAWAGEEQIAQEYAQWARGTLRPDRESVDPHPEEVQRLEQYLAPVSDSEQLRRNVREEAAKFELQFAPYQDIVGVPYQEGQLFKKAPSAVI